MPENDNCAQEGRPAAPEGANSDTYSMIWNAKSLQTVVKKLEWNEAESPQSDPFLFRGTTLAEAILLSLATEIALKALLSLEQKKDPPHIHDLLKLFEQLEPDTQKLLRAEMPGWPEILEVSPFDYGSLPEILWSHRDAHTHWRFIHEKQMGVFRTAELNRALMVIINAYDKRSSDRPEHRGPKRGGPERDYGPSR